MKYLLFILFFSSVLAYSQKNIERSLIGIRTLQQAEKFVDSKKGEFNAEVLRLTIGNEISPLIEELSKLSKGQLKIEENNGTKTVYKVIDKKKTVEYNVSLMEFDSKKTPLSEINSIRAFILKGIKSGEHKFHNLARVYSLHPSAPTGGNLGWVKQGTFSKRFDIIMSKKKKGQVFSFDEHRERKHYVLMKAKEDREIEGLIVLKVSQKS